jgi:thiol-disulfide isomerase/thioredoxin
MKQVQITSILLIFWIVSTCISCNTEKYGAPVKDPTYILSSFDEFWSYWNESVKLSRNFVAFDEVGLPTSKTIFMDKMSMGDYLPLRLTSTDSLDYYRLYKINKKVDEQITNAIRSTMNQLYQHFQLVGKSLPGFNFTDLHGNVYDSGTCKGKTVVLNIWFTQCVPCVAEMPALNKLVNLYKERNDILFLSLAGDSEKVLAPFLNKTRIDYKVVPNLFHYFRETLHVPGYPMQVIINKNGIVSSVPENYTELAAELKKETAN